MWGCEKVTLDKAAALAAVGRLWADFDAAGPWWLDSGQPGSGRFGLTVAARCPGWTTRHPFPADRRSGELTPTDARRPDDLGCSDTVSACTAAPGAGRVARWIAGSGSGDVEPGAQCLANDVAGVGVFGLGPGG